MFFQELGNSVKDILDFLQETSVDSRVNQLLTLASIALVITIIVKGYKILAGKTQDPIRDLVWDLATKAIIIGFLQGTGNWIGLVRDALNGIYEWAGTGTSMYALLDEMFDQTKNLAYVAYDKGSFGSGFVGETLVYIGFEIMVLPTLWVIIVTQFSQTILVILTPIAIYCLLYTSLKNVFTQWLNMLLANTFTVFFISLFSNATMAQMYAWIKTLNATNEGPTAIGMKMIVLGVLFVALIFLARSLAEKLANISADGIAGAAMIGAASAAAKPATMATSAAKAAGGNTGIGNLAKGGIDLAKRTGGLAKKFSNKNRTAELRNKDFTENILNQANKTGGKQ